MSKGQTGCGCGDSFCGDCAGGGCGDNCAGGGCDGGGCDGGCPKDQVIAELRANLNTALGRLAAAEAELGNMREVAVEIDAFFDRVDALAEARKTLSRPSAAPSVEGAAGRRVSGRTAPRATSSGAPSRSW
jgi:hypothetical protein